MKNLDKDLYIKTYDGDYRNLRFGLSCENLLYIYLNNEVYHKLSFEICYNLKENIHQDLIKNI